MSIRFPAAIVAGALAAGLTLWASSPWVAAVSFAGGAILGYAFVPTHPDQRPVVMLAIAVAAVPVGAFSLGIGIALGTELYPYAAEPGPGLGELLASGVAIALVGTLFVGWLFLPLTIGAAALWLGAIAVLRSRFSPAASPRLPRRPGLAPPRPRAVPSWAGPPQQRFADVTTS